jgi:hypothetical protein
MEQIPFLEADNISVGQVIPRLLLNWEALLSYIQVPTIWSPSEATWILSTL